MEAGIIQFDPASEFEIIETIDFEEEIQRPEDQRFFTLDEQLDDYFDKVLPKKKKVTKFELQEIATEVSRIRELYEDIVTTTDVGYTTDLTRKSVSVSWVKPIYNPFEYAPYSFAESWLPLYERGATRIPNYYQRMLSALPKPFRTTGKDGVALTESGEVVDMEGKNSIFALSTYQRTKGIIHDDGSFTVEKLPVANTADDIKRKGFYIFPREQELPNPMATHPFLSSNAASAIETTEDLNDIFPTIEAILTHAVPKTSSPYVEGKPYLKLYDVKLSQIPWNIWKDQFPPVDTISTNIQVASVKFPDQYEETAPSKSLQDKYIIQWSPALNPRFWLMQQEDAGNIVVKLLMSRAGEAGQVPPQMLGDKPVPVLPKTTPEECFITDQGFDAFLNSGVYRGGMCVPTTVIAQERMDRLREKKLGWTETAGESIIKDHVELLSYYQLKPQKEKVVKYEKYVGQPDSELHKFVTTILADKGRMAVDKAEAIQLLLYDTDLKDNKYFDKAGSFVICLHTMSVLKGDLIDDRLAFYDKWAAIDEGYRVCKFCGEQINADVLVAQDDFDENGNAIINYGSMSSANAFQGDGHVVSFTNSLRQLKLIFELNNSGESVLYLLLSLMQVLPEEGQVLPVLQFIRKLSAVIRMNKKIEKVAKERIEGILGIVGMVTILQVHVPFLIPRRSFGSKILRLTGYPRDTDDTSDSPTLDILISVLRTTFQETPNTFKGPITVLLRGVISKPKDIRKESLLFLKQASIEFKAQFANAKERYVAPTESGEFSQLTMPILTVPKPDFSVSDAAISHEVMAESNAVGPKQYLSPRLPPNVSQQPVMLYKTDPSSEAEFVTAELNMVDAVTFSDADISKRIKVGFPKALKIPKLDDFLKSDTDGISFLTLLNRILDVLSIEKFDIKIIQAYRQTLVYLQTRISGSLLRDSARGIVYELLHEVLKAGNKAALVQSLTVAFQRDLVLSMILLTEDQASTQDRDLRAKERETFKSRMRQMNDTEREVTKMLLDIGIAGYIITNEDREIFAKEYRLPDPEAEYNEMLQEMDEDMPEEGYNAQRDVEDDANPVMTNGVELDADRGDYTDRRAQPYDRDYEAISGFDYEEGFGV